MEQEKSINPGRATNIWLGLFLVAAGLLTVAYRLNTGVPGWLVSWPAAVMGSGLLLAVYHRFKPGIWIVPVLWGGWLLVDREVPALELDRYNTALTLIMAGLLIILLRHRPNIAAKYVYHKPVGNGYLEFTCFGTSTKRDVANQDFTGADVVCALGHTVIDLSKANLQCGAHIDVTVFMGNTKILIPESWIVYDDITTFFGDVKYRGAGATAVTPDDMLVTFDGTAVFGGIEIISC